MSVSSSEHYCHPLLSGLPIILPLTLKVCSSELELSVHLGLGSREEEGPDRGLKLAVAGGAGDLCSEQWMWSWAGRITAIYSLCPWSGHLVPLCASVSCSVINRSWRCF